MEKRPLGLEPCPKRRPVKSLAQSRHDPATDVDTAAGAERQRKITGRRSEEGAEQVDGLSAEGVATFQRAGHDLGGSRRRRCRAGSREGLQCAMNVDQSTAAYRTLGRRVAVLRCPSGKRA